MSKLFILHNNRCSKSRNAVKLLEEKGVDFEIVNYLEGILSKNDIKSLLKKLNLSAEALVRKTESIYKENFKGNSYSEEEWIQILQENPKLIERPIVYDAEKAAVGRPIENIDVFFN